MARKLVHEAVDRRLGASGGPGLQPLADEHDEHGLGGGQVLAHQRRRHGRDDDRQVGRDLALEQVGDGLVERFVAGDQREEQRCVNAQERVEDAQEVEQQQDAHRRGEAEVLHARASVPVDRMIFADDVHD